MSTKKKSPTISKNVPKKPASTEGIVEEVKKVVSKKTPPTSKPKPSQKKQVFNSEKIEAIQHRLEKIKELEEKNNPIDNLPNNATEDSVVLPKTQAEYTDFLPGMPEITSRTKKVVFVGSMSEERLEATKDEKASESITLPPVKEKTAKEKLEEDKKKKNQEARIRELEARYKAALEENDYLIKEREALFELKRSPEIFHIKPAVDKEGHSSEATACIVFSDWHVEEEVDPATVNGLNMYNLEIARARATDAFRNGLKLLKIFQKDTHIDTLILALLGDFFSNSIHEELLEINQMRPGDAAWFAQNLLMSGINFLLANSNLKKIIIPCHSGNHGRMTKKVHIATESGNSLETYMYHNMAKHYENESRVNFQIESGQHSYVKVYDINVRFLHGHSIKYAGGVGGITIPVKKAIAQWDKMRSAMYTVFGHFHQFIDGGNFLGNGSLIGLNPYAISIKAEYERPKQMFFLISNRNGGEKSIVAPIHLRQGLESENS